MSLKDINLTEEQQEQLQKKLDAWKLNETKKIEEKYTEKYEQMEADLKEEYEELVAEIKENMKKVYTKRFNKALREMYEEIKAEVMVESLHSPEAKALEEVKATVYPLINEATAKRHRDEFTKLAEMYESLLEDFELLKGANKKAQLVESLSPEVRKVVVKLLGEGNEEEIVERFAEIKKALKEEVSHEEETLDEEDVDDDNDDTDDEMDEEIVIRRNIREDEEDDEDESLNESQEDDEFKRDLNEQLYLAGIRKSEK
jgi:hypothetical protein